jgi:hypothetical protein
MEPSPQKRDDWVYLQYYSLLDLLGRYNHRFVLTHKSVDQAIGRIVFVELEVTVEISVETDYVDFPLHSLEINEAALFVNFKPEHG